LESCGRAIISKLSLEAKSQMAVRMFHNVPVMVGVTN